MKLRRPVESLRLCLSTDCFFLACGDHDALFGITTRFEARLSPYQLPSEFHPLRGSHNWGAWNQAVPLLEARLKTFFCAPQFLKVPKA